MHKHKSHYSKCYFTNQLTFKKNQQNLKSNNYNSKFYIQPSMFYGVIFNSERN